MSRTALELIGQSGLGYSFDSLEDGATPHRYSQAVKMFMCVFHAYPWLSNQDNRVS